ncbi:signal peptidase subunit-domain-containing protein [Piptocephalis cylindrospora]|uniref:Signal peptidase complex subunit 3 n=1 Tax=Piptocephalis cylindrospora TaxID=1907219 RepID=A0A4V1IYR4_9FUNG|nr:signal peptidase subunit-domain-containing protein [Piptocephalis cylindrospora]|eukprot:RKP15469.1 signal peptidase subunit-domain-containing protein [Piptocephalis cylindrospora]
MALPADNSLPVDLRVVQSKVLHGRHDIPEYRGGVRGDYVKINVDMDADLTGLWNWNTKLVFVDLVAEFATPTHPANAVTIWDTIIYDADSANLRLRGIQNKYALSTHNHKLKEGQVMNLTLQWNIVPWVGVMRNQRQGGRIEQFILPA